MQRPSFTATTEVVVVLRGISLPFGTLSLAPGKIIHVLRTRAPLYRGRSPFSHDLHVLGAPLTFALSQDQTLLLNPGASSPADESASASLLSSLVTTGSVAPHEGE